jgi:DNA topoisomerase VI subunit B
MAPTLQRETFSISRSAEYFTVKTLQSMTGQPAYRFADVILKELADNAVDAAETAGVPPVLDLAVRWTRKRLLISVGDNGNGIPAEVVEKILDFDTRTSDKSLYRTPTRGAQGNALKTILGIPVALGSDQPVVIEAQGVKHLIHVRIDPAGNVIPDRQPEDSARAAGTRVALALPSDRFPGFEPWHWAQDFALLNPHLMVHFRETATEGYLAHRDRRERRKMYRPTQTPDSKWRKFLPTDLPSAWWFSAEELAKLSFSLIAKAREGGRDLTLRDFVRQFRGLSRTAKAAEVRKAFPAIERLSDLDGREDLVPELLQVMRKHADAPSPAVLGRVGKDHLVRCLHRYYGVRRHWYKTVEGVTKEGIPFVFEAVVAETKRSGRIHHGVNFSPAFKDPGPFAGTPLRTEDICAYGVESFLTQAHCESPEVRFAAAVHLSCPSLDFLDHGKARIDAPQEIADAASSALWQVCKTMYREGERRQKDALKAEKARQRRERQERPTPDKKVTLKDAVFAVLEEAWEFATKGGLSKVSRRSLFYPVRKLIQRHTDEELKYGYFSQDLLTQYRDAGHELPGLTSDPRGVLYEPHRDTEVHLGTCEVESYEFPSHLYDKILYVEKKGLWPYFKDAQLAERYDMAVVAGEGYATEACRILFANAEQGRDFQLFVLHDADPHGYNIARTLAEETRRMPKHRITMIDLGLSLGEALEMGLETEEFFRKAALPKGLTLTGLEREYFGGQRRGKGWICRRVELNAFRPLDLVDHIEEKLKEKGVRGKVIPSEPYLAFSAKDTLRVMSDSHVREALAAIVDCQAMQKAAAERYESLLPSRDEIMKWVREDLGREPSLSWRQALSRRISMLALKRRPEAEAVVREHLRSLSENE